MAAIQIIKIYIAWLCFSFGIAIISRLIIGSISEVISNKKSYNVPSSIMFTAFFLSIWYYLLFA